LCGDFERETKDILIVVVPDKSSETLLSVIKNKILEGTTIISDCWKSYNCLSEHNFQHLTVNHTYNFVDPETNAHTQNIERTWRDAKSNIPRYGRSTEHMDSYIAEFLFKRKFPNHVDRIHAIFVAIQNMKSQNITKSTVK